MPTLRPDGTRDHRAEYQLRKARRAADDVEAKRSYARAYQRALRALAADNPTVFALYLDAERAAEANTSSTSD